MHRILVDPDELLKDRPALGTEARHHLKVVRLRVGEEVELFDGRGGWRVFRCDGSRADDGLVAAAEPRFTPRAAGSLTLFACVTKGSRWDWTVEKATELGVTRIVPVISERTIVRLPEAEREAKRVRWQRIAEEAARQSDAKWLPEILRPVDFAASLELVRACRCYVGALTDPPPPTLGELVAVGSSPDLAAYVGPEGDFSPDELARLLEIAVPASFGSTVLRAETAAIYAISVLKSALDAAGRTTTPCIR